MVTQRKKFFQSWVFACTVIAATAGVLALVYHGFEWKATTDAGNQRRDTAITDVKDDIKSINAKMDKLPEQFNDKMDKVSEQFNTKMDKVSASQSKIIGELQVILEMQKEKIVAGN